CARTGRRRDPPPRHPGGAGRAHRGVPVGRAGRRGEAGRPRRGAPPAARGGAGPLRSVNPRATLKYLMEQRRPLYASVATHTIATDARTPEEIADEVAALIKPA